MSQARQIHAYALAARRGWHADAIALVERAFASMVRDYHGRDDREGWIFSIRRDGAVVDTRRDLYTHAFVLLAIASYVEATGHREALALADETLAFIERHMAAPAGGGFVEELPPNGGVRRQNPHMHLFEGLLALWECSRQERHLAQHDAAVRPVRHALLPAIPASSANTSRPTSGRPTASSAASSSPAITMNGCGCCAASSRPVDDRSRPMSTRCTATPTATASTRRE